MRKHYRESTPPNGEKSPAARGMCSRRTHVPKMLKIGTILVLASLARLSLAQENSDKIIDLETYNAQLLGNLGNKGVPAEEFPSNNNNVILNSNNQNLSADNSDHAAANVEPDYEVEYEDHHGHGDEAAREVDDSFVIGRSVASSTSSAISFLEEAASTTPQPQPSQQAYPDYETHHQEEHLRVEDGVPLDDPHLGAVFPDFAEAYYEDESQRAADLADLDFVDQSDFAILNSDGSVESYGTTDDLGQAVDELRADEDYEITDYNQDLDINPGGGGGGGGPTTLMLFNIFSPDEVDFLSTLVGDEALEELRDAEQDLEHDKDNGDGTTTTPKSRRPPQFNLENDGPKNVYPSSQGNVLQDSNIRDSLQVYRKSEFKQQQQHDILEGEGEFQQESESTKTYYGPKGDDGSLDTHHQQQQAEQWPPRQPPINYHATSDDLRRSQQQQLLHPPRPQLPSSTSSNAAKDNAKAEERRQKMEDLLQKLSDRYQKKQEEKAANEHDNNDNKDHEDKLDEAIKETDEKMDRMKTMIENLKAKLGKSRPGVNTINMKDIGEPQPPPKREAAPSGMKLYHTTQPPMPIDKVGQMIGEKLRDMTVGVHRLDLDDMLDLDMVNIKSKGEPYQQQHQQQEYPQYPVGPPVQSYQGGPLSSNPEVKSLPKRQILHPKLTRERPGYGGAHRPSVNLKSYITPAPDLVDPKATEYRDRPIIPRYVDAPTGRPYTYPAYNDPDFHDENRPRLKGYKPKKQHSAPSPGDPYPNTKELPPYHYPTPTTTATPAPYHEEKSVTPSIPPALFYSDKPKPLDPYSPPDTPTHAPLTAPVPVNSNKYVPSSSYRKPLKNLAPPKESHRSSKEYSPAVGLNKHHPHPPPPSYDYKQPNIRFDERPPSYKPPHIEVTPKNLPLPHPTQTPFPPVTTTTTEAPHPNYVKSLSPYKPPPPPQGYARPSYESQSPSQEYGYNPTVEGVSSLVPPRRGQLPPVGHRGPPPGPPASKQQYHTPKPTYLSTMMHSVGGANRGYVPPSSGNYIYKNLYTTPTPPPPDSYSTMAPPSHGYSTPKSNHLQHVSSMAPPSQVYSTPKPHHMQDMLPPHKDHYGHHGAHLKDMKPPTIEHHGKAGYSTMVPPPAAAGYSTTTTATPKKPSYSHMSTMTPPPAPHYDSAHIKSHYHSTMAPPSSNGYDTPRPHAGLDLGMKPPSQSYESGMKPHYMSTTAAPVTPHPTYDPAMKTHLGTFAPPQQSYTLHHKVGVHSMDPPHPDGKYLPPPKETAYKPPTGAYEQPGGGHHNLMKTMHPPQSSYESAKSLAQKMGLLKPPQVEYLQHAMTKQTYLPPPVSGSYKSPAPNKMRHLNAPPAASSSYATDPMEKYLQEMQIPSKKYLPPTSGQGGMKPPTDSYEDPLLSEYLAVMQVPSTKYGQHSQEYMRPPATASAPTPAPASGDHGLLPKLAGYLSPISEYMASMLPPLKDYVAPSSSGAAGYNGESIEPPTREYLVPNPEEYYKERPPSQEYLTPFLNQHDLGQMRPPTQGLPGYKDPKMISMHPPQQSYSPPKQPQQRPPPKFVPSPCPPVAPRGQRCELVKDTCQSPNQPDPLCPGNGYCCFDGCANVCTRIPVPFIPGDIPIHIPPNAAYLVPGKEYLYLRELQAKVSSKRIEEDGEHYMPPPASMYHLAELENLESVKSLPDLPTVSQLPPGSRREPNTLKLSPPTEYKPPALDPEEHRQYLPPPPSGDPKVPADGYTLPNYESHDLPDALRPSQQYLPPKSSGYQVSKEHADQGAPNSLLQPPKKQYLPPPHPSELPPSPEALVGDLKAGYEVPSKEYLPPPNPSELPPAPGHPDLALGDVQTGYKVPSKEYLPPPNPSDLPPEPGPPVLGELKNGLELPSKEYLPPPSSGSSYKPPAAGLGPHSVPGTGFKVPSKEYLPPVSYQSPPHSTTLKPVHFSRGHNTGSFKPPDSSYKDPHLEMAPPSEGYVVPANQGGPGFLPPAPGDGEVPGVHYKPPSKSYLPPPPSKYNPPAPEPHLAEVHNGLEVPTKEYLPPPPTKLPDYQQPHPHHEPEYHSVGGALMQPPSKEYLPPPPTALPHAVHHHHHHSTPKPTPFPPPPPHPPAQYHETLQPPTKQYLPPLHAIPQQLTPEPKPHHPHPPAGGVHYSPPSKEYLPPPSTSIEEIGHAIHVTEHHQHHVNVPPKLLPVHHKEPHRKPHTILHDSKVHITASVAGGGHGDTGGGYQLSMPPHPHAINIQINLPDKDEDKHYAKTPAPPIIAHHKEPHPPPPHAVHHITTNTPFRHDVHPKHHDKTKVKDYDVHPSNAPPPPHHHGDMPKVMPHMLPHHSSSYEEDDKIMPHLLPGRDPHDLHAKHGLPPLLPQYVPPPASTYLDEHVKLPSAQYLPTDARLPGRQYLPIHRPLPPKQYLDLNPYHYSKNKPKYKDPALEVPLLPDEEAAIIFQDGSGPDPELLQTLRPPQSDYLPPSGVLETVLDGEKVRGDYLPPPEPTEAYRPPDKDYLPPGDDDPEIPPPPAPEDLPADIDDGLPSRGPQFPVKEQFRLRESSKYVPPPARPSLAEVEEVLNSQVLPPSSTKEHYIPPKTKFDVPKNFVRPEDVAPVAPLVPLLEEVDNFGTIDILDAEQLPEPPNPGTVPEQLTEQPFLGLAKLIDPERKKSLKELEELRDEVQKLAKLVREPQGPQVPPIPTLPPQPASFMPFLEKLEPNVLQRLQENIRTSGRTTQGGGGGRDKIPGKPGVDYPDFKTIPVTDFSCENFILEGFYADTFTSCQVFHVCESGKRQSSFLCPRGTIFNQKHRVCDWWYNVKCEDATEFYDLNLDLLLLEKGVSPTQGTSLNVPPPIDPLAGLAGLESNDIEGGDLFSGSTLDLLNGNDGLNSLVLDDLVLSNLLGRRRMDTGVDDDNAGNRNNGVPGGSHMYHVSTTVGGHHDTIDDSFLTRLLERGSSLAEASAPSSVAAPVQRRHHRKRKKPSGRRRNRKKKPKKNNTNNGGNNANQESSKGSGGGFGSLCQIMNICDSQPSPSVTNEHRVKPENGHPKNDVPFASSQNNPLVVEAPDNLRLGEKSAAEVADIIARSRFNNGPKATQETPKRSEVADDSVVAASTFDVLTIGREDAIRSEQASPRQMMVMDDMMMAASEMDFGEGQSIKVTSRPRLRLRRKKNGGESEPPEEYRMSNYGQPVGDLDHPRGGIRLPMASINFEHKTFGEERNPKMIEDNGDEAVTGESKKVQASSDDKTKQGEAVVEEDVAIDVTDEMLEKTKFKLEKHHVDREAKTWTPMKMNSDGKLEQTDFSEPIDPSQTDESDWKPSRQLPSIRD